MAGEPTVVDWITLIIAGLAAVASAGSIFASIHLGRLTRQHEDRLWHKEQMYRAITDFVDAANDAVNFLNTDIVQAAGAGAMTAEKLDAFRDLQKRVQAAHRRLSVMAPVEIVSPAADWMNWLDNMISGFPAVGDGPRALRGTDPLIMSLSVGISLLTDMTNPIRRALGSEGQIQIAIGSAPNTYGR